MSSIGWLRFGLQLDGDVAGVCFGDCGEAHLQAGAAGDDFDVGVVLENCFDVLEDAVGLGERAAGGHDVVEDEAAFVHLGQQVGAERLIAKDCAYDEEKACKQQVEAAVEGAGEPSLVEVQDLAHEAGELLLFVVHQL